jgi:hypothetical protein
MTTTIDNYYYTYLRLQGSCFFFPFCPKKVKVKIKLEKRKRNTSSSEKKKKEKGSGAILATAATSFSNPGTLFQPW